MFGDILSRFGIGAAENGLPPSLLRDNAGTDLASLMMRSGALGYGAGAPGIAGEGAGMLPVPMTEQQAVENMNSASEVRRFAANFIEPGPVLYKGKDGEPDEMVNVTPEALEAMAKSFIGKPVIDWDHADTWNEMIGDGMADGVVYDVWKGDGGWWDVGFVLWTKSSIEHAQSGDWSVSCAWKTVAEDGQPGRWHNIDFTQTLLEGVYTHLALVKKPRYENARIRANSSGNGGFKMAWEFLRKKKPEVLRLNSLKERTNDVEVADMLLSVDGEAVPIKDLIEKHNAMRHHAEDGMLNAEDHDHVEVNGVKYNVGELREAHRMHSKHNGGEHHHAAHRNAEEPKEPKEEKPPKENTRRNDVQLAGAGSEKTGKLGGANADKQEPVVDNPDYGVEAAKELAKHKERINSLEKELKAAKGEPSRELREAGSGALRFAPVGGSVQDRGPVTMEDRIRAGADAFRI